MKWYASWKMYILSFKDTHRPAIGSKSLSTVYFQPEIVTVKSFVRYWLVIFYMYPLRL